MLKLSFYEDIDQSKIIKSLYYYDNVFNVNTFASPSLQLTFTEVKLQRNLKHVNMSNVVTLFCYCHLVVVAFTGKNGVNVSTRNIKMHSSTILPIM